ncbi:VOC family protein [Sphingomonas bacterium]|uniref:VOC family protein n=1 Tax=Sphingomonas bacterium TaxID=1895847 RepID=UPI00157634F7|nr:VOC family protein [Sphingomonas bacterium]
MATRHGFPVWYELVTPDPDAATGFYQAVTGWTIDPAPAAGPDYRMIAGPDGGVAGMLRLDAAMQAGGARPTWLAYIGVDDPDHTAGQACDLGGGVVVPPTDIPGIGRFALLTDPQGAPFYVMRGHSDAPSTSFAEHRVGRFGWNELSTTDGDVALAFYGALFGWENRETMDMGPMGGYHYLDREETRLGAMVEMKGHPAGWRLYINVADIDAAVEAVRAGGGRVDMGPYAVPTGNVIVIGTDPQGAGFALVGPGK